MNPDPPGDRQQQGLADPGPVAQTFFVDENVGRRTRLDAVVTVADAKWLKDRLKDAPEAVNTNPTVL